MRQESVRRYAPLGVAVLVLVVLGVVWGVLRLVDPPGEGVGGSGSGAGSGEPPVIELTGWSAPVAGEADPRYRLSDGADLPAGPAAVAVHRVVAGDTGRLREALRQAASDGGLALTVEDSGHWTLGTGECAVTTQSSGTVVSDCAGRVQSSGDPADPRTVVGPVLEAAGLGDADVRVETRGGPATVVARPAVDGLPTTGLATSLLVSDGSIVSGDGWVVATPAGAEYPVLTAREAYDRLVRTPLPMPLMACPEPLPPDANPLPCGGPVTVTGAHMGLSLQPTAEGHLLVPSWLFDVDGWPEPLVQVAVQPRFLRPAADDGSGSGSGSPGASGSSGTATAVPPAPGSAPPSVGPGEPVPDPVSRFTAVARGDDDRRLDVTFWGGVQACYSYDVRVVEDDRRVRLYLVENRTAGDKPCIDLAEQKHVTVALERPLGLRTVEDGDSGQVLLGPSR
jgi:hypothetical protein